LPSPSLYLETRRVGNGLKGRVDATDGQFLQILHTENIYDLFTDPSPGMAKEVGRGEAGHEPSE
jgi:hypothetical protein